MQLKDKHMKIAIVCYPILEVGGVAGHGNGDCLANRGHEVNIL